MKRSLSLLLLFLLVVPITGCCRRGVDSTATVGSQGWSFSVTCHSGAEESSPVQESLYKAITQLDRAIQRAAPTGGIDECGLICTRFGPDSDECNQCRITAGISIMNPTYAACQGTSYAPLPLTRRWGLRVETNRGTQYSPSAYTFSKDMTSIRFDGCGGERAEYTIQDAGDRQALSSWANRLVDAGVREVREVAGTPPPSGAENETLFRLKDDSSAAATDCLQPDANPLRCGVIVGGFVFDAEVDQPAHGILSELMLPQPVSGIGGGYVFNGRGFFRRR